MTAYAPTDVRAINASGGCGQQHLAPADLAPGDKMTIDCPPCEAVLLNLPGLGWSARPDGVALTPDERFAYEKSAEAARHRQATTWSDPTALAAALQQALAPTAGPSLIDMLKSASAEELDAVRALLGPAEPAKAPVKKTAAKKAAPAADGE